MTQAVAHRGPDGEGLYCNGPVALGHRRLSIIDLSELGQQPMADPQSGCVIVYNGELYNYIEVRNELIAMGVQFVSQSDTEVILKAYSTWGESCVQRFNGMWSFAIHDRTRNVLFCSRDRFGEKPFYYCESGKFFAFGSELRQLLPLLDMVAAERGVVLRFLHHREAEPLDISFFRGIRKLPAGHSLTYDINSGRISLHRHYDIARDDSAARLSDGDALERFSELLRDSIRLRLRSDVRVGTCLSGGLDSSSIAIMAAPLYDGSEGVQFSALTGISEDPASDESGFAAAVVKRAGLDWLTVRPSYEDFRSTIGTVVRAQEEPFLSPSPLMQFHVMQLARKSRIAVLLDGQGGDETLLGYQRYYADYCVALLRQGRLAQCADFLRGLAANGDRGAFRQLVWNLLYFHAPAVKALAQRELRAEVPAPDPSATEPRQGQARGGLFELQKSEIEVTNLPGLLRLEDKNAMWHSVETRLPFLDHRLVEFSLSVPADMKLKSGWSKHILRKSVSQLLPDEITWRKSKLGFAAPESRWMNQHRDQLTSAVCSSPIVREIAPKLTAEKLAAMPAGAKWRLYSLALWAEEFKVAGLH